jgi:cation:H+ antiporter
MGNTSPKAEGGNSSVVASVQILLGFISLIVGGELLVRGASQLAAAIRVSSLVIGLTVVAFGTSSPELAVSLRSALAGNADIAVGNVVGSNVFNVLFILGVSASIVPLTVAGQLIRRDVPLMVLASLAFLLLGLDGRIGRLDGLLLCCGLLAFTFWSIGAGRRESIVRPPETDGGRPPLVASGIFINICLIVAGLALLAIGSNWLIAGSVAVASHLGVSELIIGLTIVAAGTSLPEVVTSVVAACRGERDIAVGNVVGSNLFNLLCVLGLSSCIAPDGLAVSPAALRFDIPVMVAVAVACLPIFFTGHVIARWEGALFLGYYLIYVAYLTLDASGSSVTRTLASVMLVFVIPLTILTLLITVYRSTRRPRSTVN